jgi:hypothetical protein
MEIENQRPQKSKVTHPGKTLEVRKTVRKRLIALDISEEEPEDILYAELSDDGYDYDYNYAEVNDKETFNVTEKSLAVWDLAKGDFIL